MLRRDFASSDSVRDRTISDPQVGGEVFLVHDWSIVGDCPATFVEIEANVSSDWTLEQARRLAHRQDVRA